MLRELSQISSVQNMHHTTTNMASSDNAFDQPCIDHSYAIIGVANTNSTMNLTHRPYA